MIIEELYNKLKTIKNNNSRLLDNNIFLMGNNRIEQLRLNELFSVEKGIVDSIIIFYNKIEIELEENDDEILPIETLRELFYFLDTKNNRGKEKSFFEKPVLYLAKHELELELISSKDNKEEVLVFKKL